MVSISCSDERNSFQFIWILCLIHRQLLYYSCISQFFFTLAVCNLQSMLNSEWSLFLMELTQSYSIQEGLYIAVARRVRDDPSSLPPEILASSHLTIRVRHCHLSVSSKDIHLSKHAKVSGIHCTLWPQCTNITDGQTDGHWHHSISARCIYYISRWFFDNAYNYGIMYFCVLLYGCLPI